MVSTQVVCSTITAWDNKSKVDLERSLAGAIIAFGNDCEPNQKVQKQKVLLKNFQQIFNAAGYNEIANAFNSLKPDLSAYISVDDSSDVLTFLFDKLKPWIADGKITPLIAVFSGIKELCAKNPVFSKKYNSLVTATVVKLKDIKGLEISAVTALSSQLTALLIAVKPAVPVSDTVAADVNTSVAPGGDTADNIPAVVLETQSGSIPPVVTVDSSLEVKALNQQILDLSGKLAGAIAARDSFQGQLSEALNAKRELAGKNDNLQPLVDLMRTVLKDEKQSVVLHDWVRSQPASQYKAKLMLLLNSLAEGK